MSSQPEGQFKEMALTFITEEIELGLTFAALAATESARGDGERAREVCAKAEQAAAEAEHRLIQAQQRGWDVAALLERLGELRARLKDLGMPKAA